MSVAQGLWRPHAYDDHVTSSEGMGVCKDYILVYLEIHKAGSGESVAWQLPSHQKTWRGQQLFSALSVDPLWRIQKGKINLLQKQLYIEPSHFGFKFLI